MKDVIREETRNLIFTLMPKTVQFIVGAIFLKSVFAKHNSLLYLGNLKLKRIFDD